MIKLMIVDDESIIRKGIRTSIDWEALQVEIVGEAQNGKQALELVQQLMPDIVLTDIRMPQMDGLEFAQQLKQQYPFIKIIILSGYDDFNYARKALTIGVTEYLMKPVGADELTTLISKIGDEINKKKIQIEQEQKNQILMRENFPYIQRKWLNQLLKGETKINAALLNKASQLRIPLVGPEYGVVVVDVDDFRLNTEHVSDREIELIHYSINNIVEEVFSSVFLCTACQSDFDNINVLLNANMQNKHRIMEICNEAQRCIARYMKLSVTVGVGQYVSDLADIHESYRQAVYAMQCKVYRGKGQVIAYQEVESVIQGETSKRAILSPSEDEKELLEYLSTMDKAKIDELLDNRFKQFAQSYVSYEDIKKISLKWVILAISHLEQMGVDLSASKQLNPYAEIEKYETTDDIQRWLGGLFAVFIDAIEAYKNVRYKNIVAVAIKYIHENYSEEIRLEDISAQVFVTPNYFSRIFKEETGQHFTEWLNKYRVEKAKVMLKDVSAKIYEVAERVGYNDYKYFTHIFKKATGLTPKEYRNRP
ncbi:response regulator transcription factor [Cohnella herbarum]|uniref:Response regulator transcription factor n=1 Tax=Cohnella herbarum TaxID=2728023 RepID=A0A7Z2ZNG0_9BACL|nr:response regulator transcription factor [Cohnella herbarum]QJD86391.1 response regulator transcription factor [Cohnella herbarum]